MPAPVSRPLAVPSFAGLKFQMIASGRVSWFKPDKKFGFVELEGGIGDAFLMFQF